MNVSQKEVRPRTLEINIDVEAERVDKAFNQAFRQAAQNSQIPGFRKGKAPRAIVEQYLNQDALADNAEDILVDEVVREALKENDITPYDYPELQSVEFEKGKPAKVVITVPLFPTVTLGDYKGIEAERKTLKITDEHVNKELDLLRDRAGKLETAEPAEIKSGDFVKIHLEMDLDGKPLPEETRDTIIEVGKNVPNVDAALIGANPGDDVTAEINYNSEGEDVDPDLAGKTAIAKMKILERMTRVLPEVNDDFAKEYGHVDTLDALKATIREQLEKIAKDSAEQSMRNQVVDEAIKRAEAAFPDSMVDHEVNHRMDHMVKDLEKQGLTLDDYLAHIKKEMSELRTQMSDEASERIKGGLVLAEIAKAEKIAVKNEDLDAEMQKIADEHNVPLASVKARFSSQKEKESLMDDIFQKKIVDLLVENAKITDSEIESQPGE